MTDWHVCSLGDVLTLQRGFDITKAAQRAGEIPVVSSSGINSFHDVAMVKGPGVVIGRKGTLGTTFFLDRDFWPHDTSLWVRDFKGNDPKFCYNLLRGMELEKFDVGSANPTLNRNHVHLLQVRCPPLVEQRRIASILGAYDDLIEVNRRRIAVLEAMARDLFEEWFVRFRFPGHEGVEIVETPDGPLPVGWERAALPEIASINARSIKSKNGPDNIGYIDIASVSPGQVDSVAWLPLAEAPSRARRLVQDGSILWSTVRPNRRSFALLLSPAGDVIASTGFAVIDAISVPFSYLYHAMTTDEFVGYLVGNATGSAYPAVTSVTFERARFIVPDAALLRDFHSAAEPKLRLIANLRLCNDSLAAARDLLLPRLISGELSVVAAERELEDAA